jgi:hypothetical protein
MMSGSSFRVIGKSIVAASLLTLATPALAKAKAGAEASTPVEKASPKADGKGERLICKRFDRTGSRMTSVRACHTKEDWKKLQDGDF